MLSNWNRQPGNLPSLSHSKYPGSTLAVMRARCPSLSCTPPHMPSCRVSLLFRHCRLLATYDLAMDYFIVLHSPRDRCICCCHHIALCWHLQNHTDMCLYPRHTHILGDSLVSQIQSKPCYPDHKEVYWLLHIKYRKVAHQRVKGNKSQTKFHIQCTGVFFSEMTEGRNIIKVSTPTCSNSIEDLVKLCHGR